MVWSGFVWLLVTDQWEALANDNLSLSSTKTWKTIGMSRTPDITSYLLPPVHRICSHSTWQESLATCRHRWNVLYQQCNANHSWKNQDLHNYFLWKPRYCQKSGVNLNFIRCYCRKYRILPSGNTTFSAVNTTLVQNILKSYNTGLK
jgi:hypothetical protein